MLIHNCRKRNDEAQLRRRQNPAYRIQEQVGIACTNPDDRAQEQITDTMQRQIPHTNPENRAQEQVANTSRRQNALTNLENHRSKLLILHKKDWQENNLVFWIMKHYSNGK
jgi:hypothetical protein